MLRNCIVKRVCMLEIQFDVNAADIMTKGLKLLKHSRVESMPLQCVDTLIHNNCDLVAYYIHKQSTVA